MNEGFYLIAFFITYSIPFMSITLHWILMTPSACLDTTTRIPSTFHVRPCIFSFTNAQMFIERPPSSRIRHPLCHRNIRHREWAIRGPYSCHAQTHISYIPCSMSPMETEESRL